MPEQPPCQEPVLSFLEMTGHEMLTPLTSIKGGLEMVLRRHDRDGSLPAWAERKLTSIVSHTTMLTRLVNNLLDARALQQGELLLCLREYNLVSLVQEVVWEHQQSTSLLQHLPGRTILLDVPHDGVRELMIDVERIRRVVSHYLSNALKYSPPSAPITVGVRCDADQVRVWVRDEGKGIPAEELERIWDYGYQVPYSQAENGGSLGLGLGLYLCRAIVEHHQGTVGVESLDVGGSTFWFTLPLHPMHS